MFSPLLPMPVTKPSLRAHRSSNQPCMANETANAEQARTLRLLSWWLHQTLLLDSRTQITISGSDVMFGIGAVWNRCRQGARTVRGRAQACTQTRDFVACSFMLAPRRPCTAERGLRHQADSSRPNRPSGPIECRDTRSHASEHLVDFQPIFDCITNVDRV